MTSNVLYNESKAEGRRKVAEEVPTSNGTPYRVAIGTGGAWWWRMVYALGAGACSQLRGGRGFERWPALWVPCVATLAHCSDAQPKERWRQ